MLMEKESMQNRKPMVLVLAGPNGSGKSTIRKHKDDLTIYPNEYWSEQDILELLG